jgi:hypothetical protein
MKDMHVDPKEAVLIHIETFSSYSLAMHFGTFQLSDEGLDEPLHDLELAKQEMQIENDVFIALKPGGSWEVPML